MEITSIPLMGQVKHMMVHHTILSQAPFKISELGPCMQIEKYANTESLSEKSYVQISVYSIAYSIVLFMEKKNIVHINTWKVSARIHK